MPSPNWDEVKTIVPASMPERTLAFYLRCMFTLTSQA
jgi:hypothetical protein